MYVLGKLKKSRIPVIAGSRGNEPGECRNHRSRLLVGRPTTAITQSPLTYSLIDSFTITNNHRSRLLAGRPTTAITQSPLTYSLIDLLTIDDSPFTLVGRETNNGDHPITIDSFTY